MPADCPVRPQQNLVVFGGLLSGGTLGNEFYTGKSASDFWVFSLSAGDWLIHDLMLTPPARTNHGMASLNGGRQLLVFGGRTGQGATASVLGDTWVYDNHFLSTHAGSQRQGGWRNHTRTGT